MKTSAIFHHGNYKVPGIAGDLCLDLERFQLSFESREEADQRWNWKLDLPRCLYACRSLPLSKNGDSGQGSRGTLGNEFATTSLESFTSQHRPLEPLANLLRFFQIKKNKKPKKSATNLKSGQSNISLDLEPDQPLFTESPHWALVTLWKGKKHRLWWLEQSSVKEAHEWIRKIHHSVFRDWSTYLSPVTLPEEAPKSEFKVAIKKRRWLVLVNPWGGKKQAHKVFKRVVEPMLTIAGICMDVRDTEYRFHATEIAETFNPDEYSALVTVSGDGLMHEFINGLMKRWGRCDMPIGIVPAGSGNALAKNLGFTSPEIACLYMIQGRSRAMDVFSYRLLDEPTVRYGFLEVMWAIVSDIDLQSEHLRWAGPLRFTLMAIWRLIKLREYEGSLYYVPVENAASKPPKATGPAFPVKEDPSTIAASLGKYINLPNPSEHPDFVKETGAYTYGMLMNMAFCSMDVQPAPKAQFDDGLLDLITICTAPETQDLSDMPQSKANASGWQKRLQLLKFLLDTESGNYVNESYVQYRQTPCIVWKPKHSVSASLSKSKLKEEIRMNQQLDTVLDVDGESVRSQGIIIECLPKRLRAFVGPDHIEGVIQG